jgi:hypothetical protein
MPLRELVQLVMRGQLWLITMAITIGIIIIQITVIIGTSTIIGTTIIIDPITTTTITSIMDIMYIMSITIIMAVIVIIITVATITIMAITTIMLDIIMPVVITDIIDNSKKSKFSTTSLLLLKESDVASKWG